MNIILRSPSLKKLKTTPQQNNTNELIADSDDFAAEGILVVLQSLVTAVATVVCLSFTLFKN